MNNSGQPQFAEILADEGFRRVAAAIRASTITPQTNKRLDRRPFYEIRYGLGQDLMRQANTPANLLSALGAFLADYNRENGQMRERYLKDKNAQLPLSLQRINITTADLESITQMVDRFGARVVCNLLVAYGYASNPRIGDDEPPAELAEVEASQEVQMTDAE